MELLAWHRIVIFFFVFFVILIYIKLGQIKLFGRTTMSTKNRVLISLLFPLIFAVVLIFSSILIILLVAFIITILIITLFLSRTKIRK